MSCNTSSSSTPITFDVQYFYNNQCNECNNSGCPITLTATCVYYAGPALSCSGIATNDSLETALQKIDQQICSALGDFSNYQMNCLEAWYGTTITLESQFVDAISGYACLIDSNVNTFIGYTFPEYQASVTNSLDKLTGPAITCASA